MNFVPNMGNTEDELRGAACDTQCPVPGTKAMPKFIGKPVQDKLGVGKDLGRASERSSSIRRHIPKPGRQRGRGSVAQ